MTGNAFQCLLSERMQRQMLDAVRARLTPGGILVFDTRNRAAFRPWSRRTSLRRVMLPGGRSLTWWVTVPPGQRGPILAYTQHFRVEAGPVRRATSRLRFTGPRRLTALLADAGFDVTLCGNWDRDAFTPEHEDIVVLARTRA